jgi:hypothetical protein
MHVAKHRQRINQMFDDVVHGDRIETVVRISHFLHAANIDLQAMPFFGKTRGHGIEVESIDRPAPLLDPATELAVATPDIEKPAGLETAKMHVGNGLLFQRQSAGAQKHPDRQPEQCRQQLWQDVFDCIPAAGPGFTKVSATGFEETGFEEG